MTIIRFVIDYQSVDRLHAIYSQLLSRILYHTFYNPIKLRILRPRVTNKEAIG